MGIVFGVYQNWIWEFGDLKSDTPILWGSIWPNTIISNPKYFEVYFFPSAPSYLGPKYDGVEDNRICCFRFDL